MLKPFIHSSVCLALLLALTACNDNNSNNIEEEGPGFEQPNPELPIQESVQDLALVIAPKTASIDLAWSAIDSDQAVSYQVTLDGVSEQIGNQLSYSFQADQGTAYDVSVKAYNQAQQLIAQSIDYETALINTSDQAKLDIAP